MSPSSSFAKLSKSDLCIIGALVIMVALVAFIKFATKRKTNKSRKSQSKSISSDKLYKSHLPLNKSSRKKKSRKPRSNSTENVGNEIKQPTILTRSLENINKKSEKKKGKSKKKKSSQNDGLNIALSHENDDGGEWHLVATKEQRQARKEKKQNNDEISLTPIINSYQQPTYFMPSTAKDVAPRFARAAGEEWKCKAARRQPSSPSPSPPPPPTHQQKQKPTTKATSCLIDRDHSTAPILPTYNKWNSTSNTDSWSRFASFLQSNNSKPSNSNHQQQEETQAWNPMMSTTDITSWRATSSSSNNLFSSSSDHNTNHHHSTWNYGDGYANGGSDWLSGGGVASPTKHHHESNWMSLTQPQHHQHLPAHLHNDATWNASFPSASVSEQLAARWSLYAPSMQPTIQRQEAEHHREKGSLSGTPPLPIHNSDPWNPTIGEGVNDVDELANGDWSAPDQDWSNIGRDWTAPTCTKKATQTYFDNGSNDEESALNKLMTMSMEGNNRRRRRRKKKQPDQQQQPALATTTATTAAQSNDQTECCDEEVIASHEVVVEEFEEVKQCDGHQPVVVVEKGAGEWTTQTKKRRNKKQ